MKKKNLEKLKLTENDIVNDSSVERNGFRQRANVADDIFFKFNDIGTYNEKKYLKQFIKIISKQSSLIISFKLRLKN